MKNAVFYQFTSPLPDVDTIKQALSCEAHQPITESLPASIGFVPPLSVCGLDDQPMVHQVMGLLVVTLKSEVKKVKPSELKAKTGKRVGEIEAQECRKVYKKEHARIKDEVLSELLKVTFPDTSHMQAVIEPEMGLMMVAAPSHNKAELMTKALRGALGKLPVVLPKIDAITGSRMASWMRPDGKLDALVVFGSARLTSPCAGAVTIENDDLYSDQPQAYLDDGYEPEWIDLKHVDDVGNDGIRFRLTSDLLMKSIKLPELLEEQISADAEADSDEYAAITASRYDADILVRYAAVRNAFDAVVAGMGGYMTDGQPATWSA